MLISIHAKKITMMISNVALIQNLFDSTKIFFRTEFANKKF